MQVIENIQSSPFRESKSHRILTSLELFAGAGGLALGTHAAGFKHIGLVEWNTFAIETLRDNSQKVLGLHPDFIFHCDARNVDYQMFAGKVDSLTGGPPCQPFSHGGQSRGFSDERDMFPVLLDAVAEIMPNAILIENVKGLLREKFRDYFSYILKRLQFPLSRKEDGESWQNHYKRLCGIVRYFTAREAARLQTFPDTWHFHGSWGACMKQLGNAVPAELIRIFAQEIGRRLAKVVA